MEILITIPIYLILYYFIFHWLIGINILEFYFLFFIILLFFFILSIFNICEKKKKEIVGTIHIRDATVITLDPLKSSFLMELQYKTKMGFFNMERI